VRVTEASEPFASPEVECRVSWPHPVAEMRLLSWGWLASQSLGVQQRWRACWVSTLPLCRFPSVRARGTDGWTGLGVSSPLPLSDVLLVRRKILSQASAPLQSFTNTHRKVTVEPLIFRPRALSAASLLPRFLPLQRLPSHGELPIPAELPPQRFRCALRVSRPLDALLPP
jgi:hypothetical protein